MALVGGLLTIVFAFAVTGQPTLLNTMASLGGVASAVVLALGLLLLRGKAGSRASAGFLSIVIALFTLTIAYYGVDPIATAGSGLQALDATLVIVGDVAALAGGVLLGISLGPLTGGSGLGKAAAYAFLVGGVIQFLAVFPDVGGIITNSASLGDIGHVVDGLSGVIYVVLGPVLLYLAVRRLHRNTASVT